MILIGQSQAVQVGPPDIQNCNTSILCCTPPCSHLAWLPAVILVLYPLVERSQCDAATSCHVCIPSWRLVSVLSRTSCVYPQQEIHMLILAIASLYSVVQRCHANTNLWRRKPTEAQATKAGKKSTCHQAAVSSHQMMKKAKTSGADEDPGNQKFAFVQTFSTVCFKWVLKLPAWGDAKSHWLHLFGFSLLCLLKLPAQEEAFVDFFRCVFSCPEQLNRWPCHSLTHWLTHSLSHSLTFTFAIQRAILETCYHWDIWSEWWGDMTWLRKTDQILKIWKFPKFWKFWKFPEILNISRNSEHFQKFCKFQ